jgi:hypothetical protein
VFRIPDLSSILPNISGSLARAVSEYEGGVAPADSRSPHHPCFSTIKRQSSAV